MRKELPKYPEYKPSVVEWIGELPLGWACYGMTRRLNSIIDYRGATPKKVGDGVFLVTARNVRRGIIDYQASQEFVAEQDFEVTMHRGLPKIGDVLLTMEAPLGEVANVDKEHVAIAQRIIKITPKAMFLDPYFLKYWIMSDQFRWHITTLGTGSTAVGIKASKLHMLRAVYPPVDAQRAIVAFLDCETGKIDRLMEVRRGQIEVLREQRAAVIHHAVTQGLNPSAPKKDSGIPWLGEVPRHWEAKRLKYWVGHCSNQVNYLPEGARYLALENVESKTGRLLFDHEPMPFEGSVKLFQPNDILFGRLRPYLAKIARPEFPGVCVGELMVLRPIKGVVSPEFLQMRLLSKDFIDLVDGSTQGAKMPRANWWFVGNVWVALPPFSEQQAIVTHIASETAKVDALIAKYERELELLEEYRASLISHAVTGKIDVRSSI